MFEPLMGIFDHHAKKMNKNLSAMREHLALLVENTTARIERTDYRDFTDVGEAPASKKVELRFDTRDGYYHRVMQTCAVGKDGTVCKVYLNNVAPQNQIDVIDLSLDGSGASTAKYCIPGRSSVVFVFDEQDEGTVCAAHLQADAYVESADYERRKTISREVSDGDLHLQEPDRHRQPRTERPDAQELRGLSRHV